MGKIWTLLKDKTQWERQCNLAVWNKAYEYALESLDIYNKLKVGLCFILQFYRLFKIYFILFIFLFFKFLFLLYFTLQHCIGFAIHWHESATGVHEFPILKPPPISIAVLWDWNKNWLFPVLWPRPNLLAYWVQHFHSIIF